LPENLELNSDVGKRFYEAFPRKFFLASSLFPFLNLVVLRYTNIEEAIRLARIARMSTIQIVRALSGSVPYSEALEIARKAAPLLGISLKEYGFAPQLVIQSQCLEARYHLCAETFTSKLLVIDTPIFFQHFLFRRSQQAIRCVGDHSAGFLPLGFGCD
jgi:hypothetical protein